MKETTEILISHPLRDMYNSLKSSGRCYFGNIGSVYNLNKDIVHKVSCNNWSCFNCRKKLKWNLYHQIFYYVKNIDLVRHLVLTFDGKNVRDKVSFYDSYGLMMKNWNKYKKRIVYDYGDFNYILLPRSQYSGYCHLHILLDKYIRKDYLKDIAKDYYGMGWTSINADHDIADYLHKDFFNDYEYWIPKGKKHYITSRGIKFLKHNDYINNNDNVVLLKNKQNKNDYINIFEKMVNEKFGRMLPNSYYISEYYPKMFK